MWWKIPVGILLWLFVGIIALIITVSIFDVVGVDV